MDFFSTEFLSALLAIIVIDLVLAGDNAIVIALAARSLPAHLQKKAILWGTAGAIVVRAAMTLVVVWLLMVPGLRFLGGAALVWIAYKLQVPGQGEGGAHAKTADNFWGAMKTIVIADAVMGLDNVLAVAGAAQGSLHPGGARLADQHPHRGVGQHPDPEVGRAFSRHCLHRCRRTRLDSGADDAARTDADTASAGSRSA